MVPTLDTMSVARQVLNREYVPASVLLNVVDDPRLLLGHGWKPEEPSYEDFQKIAAHTRRELERTELLEDARQAYEPLAEFQDREYRVLVNLLGEQPNPTWVGALA